MIGTAELIDRFAELVARGGRERRLVSVTVPVEIEDPCATVFGSRMAGDRWFCWEQPDDDGFALAGLGSAHEAVSRGPDRFADLVAECSAVMRDRIADEPDQLPAGAGPVWTGGFAFAADGAGAPHWSSFPPALLVLPELSLLRRGGRTWLTLSAIADGDDDAACARLERRLATVREQPLPLFDPSPRGESRIVSVTPPGAYEESVAAATQRIRSGELDKVVLAREVAVEAPAAHDPAATFGALRELFPSCFCFCAGSPEGAFLGASPELLVRRRGASVATVALAGSTRRSADPAVDDHLGEQLLHSAKDRHEQEIVARRIERKLASRSVWVEAEAEPGLVKVANIQHLATAGPRSACRPALGDRARRPHAPDAGRGRRARRRAPRRRSPSSRTSIAAGTRRRWAGWTRPRTASSASPCARRCCATAPRTCSPAPGSSPTPTRPPSSPRPSSSSRRCCRYSPAESCPGPERGPNDCWIDRHMRLNQTRRRPPGALSYAARMSQGRRAAVIAAICAVVAPGVAEADTRYAEPNGNGPPASCPQADPCSLQAAVEDATVVDGDAVVVLGDAYEVQTNTLEVNDAIALVGATIGVPPRIPTTVSPGIVINDAGAALRDLRVESSSAAGAAILFSAGGTAERIFACGHRAGNLARVSSAARSCSATRSAGRRRRAGVAIESERRRRRHALRRLLRNVTAVATGQPSSRGQAGRVQRCRPQP